MPDYSESIILAKNVLIATLSANFDDSGVSEFQKALLEAVNDNLDAEGVIIDLGKLDIIDSYFARTINETIAMISLMGSRTILSGISPAIAISTTQLGLNLHGTATALDVNHAFDLLEEINQEVN